MNEVPGCEQGGTMVCGACGLAGHYRSTCPGEPSPLPPQTLGPGDMCPGPLAGRAGSGPGAAQRVAAVHVGSSEDKSGLYKAFYADPPGVKADLSPQELATALRSKGERALDASTTSPPLRSTVAALTYKVLDKKEALQYKALNTKNTLHIPYYAVLYMHTVTGELCSRCVLVYSERST